MKPSTSEDVSLRIRPKEERAYSYLGQGPTWGIGAQAGKIHLDGEWGNMEMRGGFVPGGLIKDVNGLQ